MLGKSAILDFLLHAGLGAASLTMFIAMIAANKRLEERYGPRVIIYLLSVPVGIGVLFCQFSTLVFMEATKTQRTEPWVITGYLAGLLVVLMIAGALSLMTRTRTEGEPGGR